MSCVCGAAFCYPQAYPLYRRHALVLAEGEAAELGGEMELRLFVSHEYFVRETDDQGFRVETAGYTYGVDAHEIGAELLSYQWHPNGTSWVQDPHAHVHDKHFRHMPTGRVSLEEVVRFLIHELHVESQRDGWEEILSHNESEHKVQRRWA